MNQQYFPFLILLAVAFVALFVLPGRQRRKVQAQAQQLQNSLTPGTPVMTTSGIHGTVAGSARAPSTSSIAPGVVVTFERRAILGPSSQPTPAAPLDPSAGDGTGPTQAEFPGDDTPGRRHRRPTDPLSRRTPVANRQRPRAATSRCSRCSSSRCTRWSSSPARRSTPELGLDLRGGTTVTLTAKTPGGKAPSQADLELARQIIEQRVNGLGVAGAEVITQGSSNIVISVPGDNGEQARQLGATAQLRFRPVVQGPAAAARRRPAARPRRTASGPASASASAGAPRAVRQRRRRAGVGVAPASAPASGSAAAGTSSGRRPRLPPPAGGRRRRPSARRPAPRRSPRSRRPPTYATLTCAKTVVDR